MKALVTGATGFVGGHLVHRLLDRGDEVTALVRSRERAANLETRGVRLVVGDLANLDAISDAMQHQEVVYHLAARLGAPNDAQLLVANRDGTAHIARAADAEPLPPRVILVSSMAAGGPSAHGAPKRAAGDDHPVTGYGRSKLAAEVALAQYPLPWVTLRPPVVYGPGDREALLPLARLVRCGVAPTFGDGSMELSFIHVDDLVEAMILAAETPALDQRVWYVMHPEIVTASGVLRIVAKTMRRSPLPLPIPEWLTRVALTVTGAYADLVGTETILRPDKIHEFYQPAWIGDPEPFMTATGWTPQHDLARGVSDTIAWYREQGWL